MHRAAERLHISQSPLSRQMQDLHRELGFALIEPMGRGIRLTSAGRHFADRVRSTLATLEASVKDSQLVAAGKAGVINIGFESTTAYFGSLGPIIGEFRARNPRIAVRLAPMSSAEQWAALHADEIAFAYGYYPPGDHSSPAIALAWSFRRTIASLRWNL